ncbi:hypothetical protein HMPREF9057_01020, partial [Actinomyces sp. oral taxon 171 str. F0337]
MQGAQFSSALNPPTAKQGMAPGPRAVPSRGGDPGHEGGSEAREAVASRMSAQVQARGAGPA